jgi:hypothetical protein
MAHEAAIGKAHASEGAFRSTPRADIGLVDCVVEWHRDLGRSKRRIGRASSRDSIDVEQKRTGRPDRGARDGCFISAGS